MSLVAKLLDSSEKMNRRQFLTGLARDVAEDAGYAAVAYSTIEVLANALSPNNAYAQETHMPEELQGDVFDYFNGEIYSKDEFHKVEDRWGFGKAYDEKDNDLKYVFNHDTELYDMLGKHIEDLYEKDKVVGVVFHPRNKKEFAVLIDTNGQRYICFKELEPGMMDALMKYDKSQYD